MFTALGDVGGLYEVMAIFFTIICQFFFAEKFFALSKVENLFKFYDDGHTKRGAKVADVSFDADKSNSGRES